MPEKLLPRRVFWHYARRHLEEMRLLFRGGRLSRKEGDWNNVIDHCLVQGAAVDALADLIDLSAEDRDRLQRTAFVHDWKKRLEIKPRDFNPEQEARAAELAQQVSPDEEIMAATEKCFSKKIIDGQASFLQKLMFYIDDITSGSKVTGYRERITETAARTKLNDDAELTKELGGRFWDVEWEACRQVEEELFNLLRRKGVDIRSPQDIPALLRERLLREVKFNETEVEGERSDFSLQILAEAQAESPAERQNEDTFVVVEDDQVLAAAVLDGATGISTVTGVDNPHQPKGRQASQQAAVGIEKNYSQARSAQELLLAGNRQIADSLLCQGTDPERSLPEHLPNAQAALVLIKKKEGIVEIAQTGDAVCLIEFTDGRIELAFPPDITPPDLEALRTGQKIAQERQTGLREALIDDSVNKLLIEGRKLNNKKDGSGVGVLDGQARAALYIRTKQYRTTEIKRIILLTDGMFLPPAEIGGEPDWKKMVEIIRARGLAGLYQEILALKNSDPELNKFPRVKKHDDATGIVIELSDCGQI